MRVCGSLMQGILTLLLMIDPLTAQEKTYAGRTFAEWQVLGLHDLEHETRVKAATALGRLGRFGHEEEAVSTLGKMIEDSKDSTLLRAAYGSILRFGDAASPAILLGLKSDDQLQQQLVLELLARHFGFGAEFSRAAIPILMDLFARHLGETEVAVSDREQIQNELQALLRDRQARNPDDVREKFVQLRDAMAQRTSRSRRNALTGVRKTRSLAAGVLQRIVSETCTQEIADEILPQIMTAAKSNDRELACLAIQTIGSFGEFAKPAIPLLIENLSNDEVDVNERRGVAFGGRDPRERGFGGAAPRGFEAFQAARGGGFSVRRSTSDSPHYASVMAIQQLGPVAKDAEEKLLELIAENGERSIYQRALEAVQFEDEQPRTSEE